VTLPVSLRPATTYSWRVQTNSSSLGWSQWVVAQFHTGVAESSWSDAGAQWIGGFNQLRTEFTVPLSRTVASAFMYAVGLGSLAASVNGQRVSDDLLEAAQSVYASRVFYTTKDCTTLVTPGLNVVGAQLGNYKWGCKCRRAVCCRVLPCAAGRCRVLWCDVGAVSCLQSCSCESCAAAIQTWTSGAT
jgi:hypothetical protein